MSNTFKIFTGSIHPTLAQEVAQNLGMPLSPTLTTQFSDGETRVEILESARNNDVFIIQPTCPPANDTLMELCILLDGFKRASVKNITAVIPYLGYARQDKKVKSREPITAKMVADFIQVAGATHVITLDVHSEQSLGFFDIPVDNLYAGPTIAEYFKNLGCVGDDYCVVSPDTSGLARASYLANALNCGVAVIPKQRPAPNVVEMGTPIGDVWGKHVILFDDMMDTCGTFVKAVEKLEEAGALRGYIACTHAVLSGEGTTRLNKLKHFIDHCVCMDTIPLNDFKKMMLGDYLIQLPSAPLISESILRHQTGESVSELFKDWRS